MSMRTFYSGQTVMVTGGTGFMGKVLLEKLVRSLPEITRIYVIVRPKKGLSSQERLTAITSKMPFTHNKIDSNTVNEKLVVLHGDVTVENLGLSDADRQKVIDEVSLVFHLAASIRMNASLKYAILQNVTGTQNVLSLCAEMKHLLSVVHLSTTYCNLDIDCAKEEVYPINLDPYKVIETVRFLPENELKKIEQRIITPHPNTYTYTKRLAEIIAKDMGNKLPLSIGRPSIVTPAAKEPIPGWVDALTGPTGVFAAVSSGIMKSMLGNKDIHPDFMPVDGAINGLIIMAYVRATKQFFETPVYNITMGGDYPLTWGEVEESFKDLHKKYPLKRKLSYFTGGLTSNRLLHYATVLFWHVFVSYVVDFLLFIFLRDPFLVNVQDQLGEGLKVLEYFTCRNFTFINDNCKQLENFIDSEEPDDFTVTFKLFDVDTYNFNSFAVARKVCLNDEIIESELYIRRVENALLYFLDRAYKFIIGYGAIWLILRVFGYSSLLSYSFWFGP